MEEKVITSKNALIATADAIREKTGSEDLLEWVEGRGFAEAIAAIEAGGVIIGEITPSEGQVTIDLEEYGVPCDEYNTPRARFLIEKTLNNNDKTHTKWRSLATLHFSADTSKNAPGRTRSFMSVTAQQSSGSNSTSATSSAVANMWASTAANGSASYNLFSGNITNNTAVLYIADPSTTYGPIAGRTYIWGVIL